MTGLYKSQHVANFFLGESVKDGVKLDQLKLIKISYIAYGWVLAVLDEKLFSEEIEAWKYGPVIPSLYHEFKKFGYDTIKGKSVRMDVTDDFEVHVSVPEIPTSDERTRGILDIVWDVYKNYTGTALIRKTHQADSPWTAVYEPNVHDIVIPDDLIKPHFEMKIRQYLNAAGRAA